MSAIAGAGELSVWMAILLGALQGATEFLPVSSSGHLALAQAWLGIDPAAAGHRFNIVAHAGTLIAVVWVYRTDVLELLRAVAKPTAHRRLLGMILLASIPLGLVLIPGVEETVIAIESSVRIIGGAFLLTAAILFVAFRGQSEESGELTDTPPSPKQSILVGLAQVVAIIPGISRSGATIAAGIGVGLPRADAARFSFLISLVAVGGAATKETIEIATTAEPLPGGPLPLLAGFVTSLVVGLLCLRALLYLVKQGRVLPFVIYLLLLAGAAITLGSAGL